jgi:transmembrane protein
MLVEGLCVGACAQYPTMELTEMLAHTQARRLQAVRVDAAGARVVIARRRVRNWRAGMHSSLHRALRSPLMEVTARTLLTLPFWFSGLLKLFAFDSGVAEMARADLRPAVAFNIATIAVQLVGSALIIANRRTWLGAGALGVFTGLTILLVHRFWTITEEPFRTIALHVSAEHIGIIGGLLGIAMLSARKAQREMQGAPSHNTNASKETASHE